MIRCGWIDPPLGSPQEAHGAYAESYAYHQAHGDDLSQCDAWVCSCGNDTNKEGFDPDLDGPLGGGDLLGYFCGHCGRQYTLDGKEVLPVTAAAPANVVGVMCQRAEAESDASTLADVRRLHELCAFPGCVCAWKGHGAGAGHNIGGTDVRSGGGEHLALGMRVRLRCAVDRYPHFLAAEGLVGTISEEQSDGIYVRMDVTVEGAEEWDNCIWWPTWRDLADDVEEVR